MGNDIVIDLTKIEYISNIECAGNESEWVNINFTVYTNKKSDEYLKKNVEPACQLATKQRVTSKTGAYVYPPDVLRTYEIQGKEYLITGYGALINFKRQTDPSGFILVKFVLTTNNFQTAFGKTYLRKHKIAKLV